MLSINSCNYKENVILKMKVKVNLEKQIDFINCSITLTGGNVYDIAVKLLTKTQQLSQGAQGTGKLQGGPELWLCW